MTSVSITGTSALANATSSTQLRQSAKPGAGNEDFAQSISDSVAQADAQASASKETKSNSSSSSGSRTRTTETDAALLQKSLRHIENSRKNSPSHSALVPTRSDSRSEAAHTEPTTKSQNVEATNQSSSTTPIPDAGVQPFAAASITPSENGTNAFDRNSAAPAVNLSVLEPSDAQGVSVSFSPVAGNNPLQPDAAKPNSTIEITGLGALATPEGSRTSSAESESHTENGSSQPVDGHDSKNTISKKSTDPDFPDATSQMLPGNSRSAASLIASRTLPQQITSKNSGDPMLASTLSTDESVPPAAAPNPHSLTGQTDPHTLTTAPGNGLTSQTSNVQMNHTNSTIATLNLQWPSGISKVNASDNTGNAIQDSDGEAKPHGDNTSGRNNAGTDSSLQQPSASGEHRNPAIGAASFTMNGESSSSQAGAGSPVPVAAAGSTGATTPHDSTPATQPQPQAAATSSQLRSSDLPETRFVNVTPELGTMTHGEMHLSLQTDRLGAVELRTRVNGDVVAASIAVEKHDTHAMLNAALPQLHQAMADRSLRLEQVSVQHGLFEAGTQSSSSQSNQDSRGPQPGIGSSRNFGGSPSTAISGTTEFDESAIFNALGRLSVHV